MESMKLQEIQAVELEILIKIDSICREQNIQYFLQYGTLIGAIRHKGFIPWDDDLDIMMPRDDYERFIQYMKNHREDMKPIELIHYSTNKKYIYPIARVSDSRYTVEYPDTEDYGLGIFVDIYPLDGCGESWEEAKTIIEGFEWNKELIRLAGIDHFVRSPLGKFRSLVKRIFFHVFKITGPKPVLKQVDRKAKKRNYNSSSIVACTVWTYVPMLREWLQPIEWEFAGHVFYIPKEYDKILRKNYNDYMQLPPENERVGHHAYKAYLKG